MSFRGIVQTQVGHLMPARLRTILSLNNMHNKESKSLQVAMQFHKLSSTHYMMFSLFFVYAVGRVYAHSCAEFGSQRWVSSLTPVYLLRHGLSLNLELLCWLNWLVSELHLSFLHPTPTSTETHTLVDFRHANLDPYVCVADIYPLSRLPASTSQFLVHSSVGYILSPA